MANYKPDLSCQNKFIAIDFSLQIVSGTFEYALAHIVENRLDLSGFDNWYSNDKKGAAAYSPTVMLKIILLGYSRGLITSRRIASHPLKPNPQSHLITLKLNDPLPHSLWQLTKMAQPIPWPSLVLVPTKTLMKSVTTIALVQAGA